MNTTAIGKRAEAQAAAYLVQRGYRVLEHNWRTRYCEIDLVVTRDQVIYFVEVKYRSQRHQGTALEYITPSKLRQMELAARFWVAQHNWRGDYQLAVVAIDREKQELVLI